jgi:hypothetical protein
VAAEDLRHAETYRQTHAGHFGRVEHRVMDAIEACRTAVLGGHTERCVDCGLIRIAHNLCRNRHCPKCQGLARAEWLAGRQTELLPVPYFHVVFTLPAPVAEIGVVAVLHTWDQNLQHHPHVRCVVPGGCLSPDGTHWIACRPGFFLPVRVLSRLYRRLFLEGIERVFEAGKLRLFGALADLASSTVFAQQVAALRRIDWVV